MTYVAKVNATKKSLSFLLYHIHMNSFLSLLYPSAEREQTVQPFNIAASVISWKQNPCNIRVCYNVNMMSYASDEGVFSSLLSFASHYTPGQTLS